MPSPLIREMIEQHGYPLVDTDNVDAFLQAREDVVLFFTENPLHFPESDDVAVILPELMRAFAGRLEAAVVASRTERELWRRYNFSGWPSLVFLRRGQYLGAITRVQDWQVYIEKIEALLAGEPATPPAVEVPLVRASTNP